MPSFVNTAKPFKLQTAIFTFVFALFISAGYTPAASAESRWVSDVLYVPLRSGKGNQFRILDRGLKTGVKLTFVSEDTEGGWTEVKTGTGELGWVRSQYLIDTQPSVLKLASAEKTIARLSRERDSLKKQLKTARGEQKSANKNGQQLQRQNDLLEKQLSEIKAISGDAVALHQRHQALMQTHKLMETELDVIKGENGRIRDDRTMTFFIYGAGAVLLGVLIALIAPSLRRKRRYSEWG